MTSTDPAKNKKLLEQDEEIFQTARLCNIGWFGSVVFSDYFSSILGLVRLGSSWSLNPFEVSPLCVFILISTHSDLPQEIRNEDHNLFERGRGNSCSVEVSDRFDSSHIYSVSFSLSSSSIACIDGMRLLLPMMRSGSSKSSPIFSPAGTQIPYVVLIYI